MKFLSQWAEATQELVLETAPWLLVGLLAAGLVHRYLNTTWIAQRLGKDAKHPILFASLMGTPLPLCSCSVLPTAQALRKGGASRGSTAAFLVSTPETGPDSVGITFGLFDPLFAILRPILAWWSAMVVGMWVDRLDEPEEEPGASEVDLSHDHAGHDHDPCCDSNRAQDAALPSQGRPGVRKTLAWVVGPLWDDLAAPLTLGFLLAGLFSASLPPELLQNYLPAGILGMFVVGLLGIPLSICATASTPLAAALVDKGLSPGAALVLLLTGPATNLATLGVVKGMLGKRGLWTYLAGIFFAALAGGLLVDAIYSYTERPLRRGVLSGEHTGHGAWVWAAGAVVAILFLVYWGKRLGSLGQQFRAKD